MEFPVKDSDPLFSNQVISLLPSLNLVTISKSPSSSRSIGTGVVVSPDAIVYLVKL